MASSTDQCYIQNHVVMDCVIKRSRCIYKCSMSLDEDGGHGYNQQNLKTIFSGTDFNAIWYVASGTLADHSLYNHDLGLTLTYVIARSNLVT